eukprot:scaffold215_cov213-Skeletonema_marinoi.AAC.1
MRTEQQVQEVFEPLIRPLTPNEKRLVEGYDPNTFPIPHDKVRECSRTEEAYDIFKFAATRDDTEHWRKVGDHVSWKSYYSVVTDNYVYDEALQFLMRYMIYLLPKDLKENVHFVNTVATAELNTKGGFKVFEEGGPGFTNANQSYNRYFGKGNTFSRLKKVFFPYHYGGNHYVGGIANVDDSTVSTFDSFGIEQLSHHKVFAKLSLLLNHALKKDEVKEQLANTDAAHDAAVAKAVQKRWDEEVKATGVINLLEEEKTTSANLSTSMAYSKTSLKSSLAQPTLSTELMRALESPSSHSITFDDNVRAASLEKLLADCDQKHVYMAVHDKMKKTLPITVDDIDVYFSASPGTSDDMARFKNDFDKLCALIDVHVQQVLCMYDMSKQTLSKFGDALSDDALCEVFASYLLDTIVALKRASLVLDNGRAIVKKDALSNPLCIDLILQNDRHGELKKHYPTIDAKRLKIGKIGNLMRTCFDAIHEGLHTSMDFMMKYFKKFSFTKQGHIMQATYLKSDLKLKCLQKAIYSLSSVDYSSSTMSSYPRFTGAKVIVPDVLLESIQYQFNLSIEGKAVLAQRRKNRKRIVESDEESDQDEDVLSLKKAASLKKTVDDTLTDDKHAELIAAKKSDGLSEWMGQQVEKAQKAKVEVASAKEVDKKVEAVLGKAMKNPKAPLAEPVDQKKAQAEVEASSAKEADQRKVEAASTKQ